MPSLAPHQAARLLSVFTNFLAVATHSLLYHRRLYPARSFLAARAYNLPVHQSRHPGVCAWVSDAVAAVAVQLRAGAARAVVIAVHAPSSMAVLERWVFDVEFFPSVVVDDDDGGDDGGDGGDGGGVGGVGGGVGDGGRVAKVGRTGVVTTTMAPNYCLGGGKPTTNRGVGGGGGGGGGGVGYQEGDGDDDDDEKDDENDNANVDINWTDVHEALRGALRRLAHAGEKSAPLPENCTFTLAIELREEAAAPIGNPQSWIPATITNRSTRETRGVSAATLNDDDNTKTDNNNTNNVNINKNNNNNNKYMSTQPIRSVHAGPLFFECWLEKRIAAQEKAKTQQSPPNSSTKPTL